MDNREQIVHGDEGLPIAVYDVTPTHIRYHMNVHWHPEHEILHVRRGSLCLRLNDVCYELHAGDVMFLPGGAIHSGEPECCDYTCVLVNLPLLMKTGDACMELCGRIQQGLLRISPRPEREREALAQLCGQMLEAHRAQGVGYPFAIKGLVFCFFGRILNGGLYSEGESGARPAESAAGKIKPAIAYMERNYGSAIRLEELAGQAGMTPNHFCRCFKAATGLTPFSYLTRYRLSKAQYALRSTDLPVTGVALDCGFSDVSHFIRLFRESCGMTPLQFRKSEQLRERAAAARPEEERQWRGGVAVYE